jgi:Mce-associated membrane protein
MWNSFRKSGAAPRLKRRKADGIEDDRDRRQERRRSTSRLIVFALLPCSAMTLAVGGGYVKWRAAENRGALTASTESVRAASETTVALLSYQPDTVDKALVTVREKLTGEFRDSFTTLTNDVVIPGAKQKQIISTATVPAAASISATDDHAVVLVFVNQTTIVAPDPPTQTTSTVKVTLDKVDGAWLISDFTPL